VIWESGSYDEGPFNNVLSMKVVSFQGKRVPGGHGAGAESMMVHEDQDHVNRDQASQSFLVSRSEATIRDLTIPAGLDSSRYHHDVQSPSSLKQILTKRPNKTAKSKINCDKPQTPRHERRRTRALPNREWPSSLPNL